VVILAACDESVTPTGDSHPISSCPCRAHTLVRADASQREWFARDDVGMRAASRAPLNKALGHMTGRHVFYRAGLINLAYHVLALGVFVATFFSKLPVEFSVSLLFPLYLPFGMDFAVQIVRTSFVSGVYVFFFYLALEWLLATALLFGVLWLQLKARGQSHE
jgi:hypothetical protein